MKMVTKTFIKSADSSFVMIRLTIAHESARRAIAQSVMSAPLGTRVSIGPAIKSRSQEALFHAMIGEIAEQAQHVGSKWSADAWKRLIVDLWSRNDSEAASASVIPALDHVGIVQLGIQTREISKERYASLITFTQWWCDENGVELSEPQKVAA